MNPALQGIIDVMFPPLCPCCGTVLTRGEYPMCIGCRLKLPETGFATSPADNDMTGKLNGMVPIVRATAWIHYRRESPQARLLHEIKYHGRPAVGRKMARDYATSIMSTGFFDGIDAIAPVPLNFWRHCSRGYNQSAHIARGVSDATSLPVIDALKAGRHGSQTRLGAQGRRDALRGVYSARPESLHSVSHLLLIDDICTTGATLYACAEALHAAIPSLRVSAFVLASTSQT